MKLRIGTLVAATMLTLTACGSISFEEWKAKAEGVEAHEYKTAEVNGSVKAAGQELKFEKVAFSYQGNGHWTSNDAMSYVISFYVGLQAKELVSEYESEASRKDIKFGSDLSISGKMSEEGEGSADFTMKFDSYGYLNKFDASGKMEGAEMSYKLTIEYKD